MEIRNDRPLNSKIPPARPVEEQSPKLLEHTRERVQLAQQELKRFQHIQHQQRREANSTERQRYLEAVRAQLQQAPAERPEATRPEHSQDRIEISERALVLSKDPGRAQGAEEDNAVRNERLEQLRAAMERSELNTPQAIERAAQALLSPRG